MKLTVQMYDVEGLDEYASDVKEAVVTNTKIAMDWEEGDELLHALLHSEDGGSVYKGNFGSPKPEKGCDMEATRFTSKNGEVLLWLTWKRKDRGVGGISIVHLASTWED